MKPAKPLSLIVAAMLFQAVACGQFPAEGDVRLPTPSQTPEATSTDPISTSSPAPTFTPTVFAATPALSPSLASLRIAFAHDEKLWLWQNGTVQPLTSAINADVHISDDGEMIAFLRDGLWVINSDGSQERQLVSEDDFKTMEPKDPGVMLHKFDWIPGTHLLVFNTRVLIDYGIWYTDDLYMVNADTLQWKVLRPRDEGGEFLISPDGQQIALTTPTQISLMNIDGSNYRVVLKYHVPFPSEIAFYAEPVWEADSQSLTVPIPPEDFFYETILPTVVWRLPVDGTPPTVFAELAPGDDGRDPRIWSPNKEHFAAWYEHVYYLYTAEREQKLLIETDASEGWFTWVDETHFIYLKDCSLWLGTLEAPDILIVDLSATDRCTSKYDFAN